MSWGLRLARLAYAYGIAPNVAMLLTLAQFFSLENEVSEVQKELRSNG